MREIKFRMLNKGININTGKQEWAYKELPYECFDDNYTLYVSDTLSQYTGLKDKNGVEIYEGDIVKYKIYGEYFRRLDEDDYTEYVVGTIKISPYKGILLSIIKNTYGKIITDFYGEPNGKVEPMNGDWSMSGFKNRVEVIGNIWENSELLK